MVSAKLIADTEAAATFLTLMGNEKRLAIMGHLVDDELSVGAIAERVDLSQSALSQHLARLRDEGLVNTQRESQTVWYTLPAGPAHAIIATLYGIYCATDALPDASRRRATRRAR
jgi:DNA-binding transcriptional ArsR family regulator